MTDALKQQCLTLALQTKRIAKEDVMTVAQNFYNFVTTQALAQDSGAAALTLAVQFQINRASSIDIINTATSYDAFINVASDATSTVSIIEPETSSEIELDTEVKTSKKS